MDHHNIEPVLASERSQQIAIGQTRLVYQRLPAGLGGTFVTAAVLTFAVWGRDDVWKSVASGALMAILCAGVRHSSARAATRVSSYSPMGSGTVT